MVTTGTYIPGRGDIVRLQFNPQSGHEQAGTRPALVISPQSYNGKVGLALVCPITSKSKGYPFEVLLPDGLEVSGVVLSDQVKSLDWQARNARYVCTVPVQVIIEVLGKVQLLIS